MLFRIVAAILVGATLVAAASRPNVRSRANPSRSR